MSDDPFAKPDAERYFEDYIEGAAHELGTVTVDEDEVIDFARRFDPQDFHADPEKARAGAFGGLIASGWHTAAMAMRLYARHYLSNASSLGSPGIDELRWPAPTRPGDTLSVRVTVRQARRSKSKPDRGVVRSFTEVFNQDRQVVMSFLAVNIIALRDRPEEA